jgi:hypothetical protein
LRRRLLKSRVFIGEDTYDLDSQVRRWRERNPEIKVLKQHPDQQLVLEFEPVRRGGVPVCDDTVWRRIDYEVTYS